MITDAENAMASYRIENPVLEANLPPDPDGMNSDRSDWAEAALVRFMEATRTDPQDALADLLCDLMHWSDRVQGLDFKAELARAEAHYKSEITLSYKQI